MKERGLLTTVSLGVYGSNAVFGQFVRWKPVAISFFHMKTVFEVSPKGPLAWAGISHPKRVGKTKRLFSPSSANQHGPLSQKADRPELQEDQIVEDFDLLSGTLPRDT